MAIKKFKTNINIFSLGKTILLVTTNYILSVTETRATAMQFE